MAKMATVEKVDRNKEGTSKAAANALLTLKEQRKALRTQFHKDLDALFAAYRENVKQLRAQKTEILKAKAEAKAAVKAAAKANAPAVKA